MRHCASQFVTFTMPPPLAATYGQVQYPLPFVHMVLWPNMQSFIEDYVAKFPHCILANLCCATASKLMHSWPLDSPFSIIHIDIWYPGDKTDQDDNWYLLNTMCDMTQFMIMIPTPDIHTHTLAKLFMQDVLLKIGFCSMVVVDDGSSFKDTFKEMCNTLNIHYHLLAKGNHQALSVERFHHYLNKAVMIAQNDRQNTSDFVPAACATAYAWNSSPINGTNIICSISAVGREFKFPFNFHYVDTPQLTQDHITTI